MTGVFGAYLHTFRKDAWKQLGKIGTKAGAALFLIATLAYFGADLDHSILARTFLFSLFSASVLCVLPALDQWRFGSSPSSRCVSAIARWSYSLYLVQGPILLLLLQAMRAMGEAQLGRSILFSAVFWALSIIASAAVYRFFEKPILAFRDSRIKGDSREKLRIQNVA